MLGLSASLSAAAASMRSFVKDNLKLYLDFKQTSHNTLKFPCEGSTAFVVDDYIDAGDISEMDGATSLTFSVWIKPDMDASVEAASILYSKQDDGNNRILTYIDVTNGHLYLETSNATSNQYARYESFPVATYQGKWTHIAHVFDGSQSTNATKTKLYINGVQKTIDTFGATQPTSTASYSANFLIGRNSASGSDYFDGKMANFGVWNRALSLEEINSVMRKNYSQLKTIEKTSLVSWWALDSSSQGVTQDSTTGETLSTLYSEDFSSVSDGTDSIT